MAYDDTRWVHRLKRIGCWDESAARQNAEKIYGTVAKLQAAEDEDDFEDAKMPTPNIAIEAPDSSVKNISDGFDKIELGKAAAELEPLESESSDPDLLALKQAKSIRGEARQEYGKIHAALNPLYQDIAKSGPSTENLVFTKYKDPQSQSQMLAQLLAFANSDMTTGWEWRTNRLEGAVSMFEPHL